MKSFTLGLLMLVGLTQAARAQDTAEQQALIARGRYLAIAADCQACHADADTRANRPFAGGKAIRTPLGDIIASNITPSQGQGIGHYTEAQFAAALREGRRADGANLFPAMPYTAFRGISDEDVHALYSYFMQDVSPVNQAVPPSRLAFPFGWRPLMGVWNGLFAESAVGAGAGPVDPQGRGRYLVDALGHCSTCHTPRNLMMAEVASRYLGGANVAGWYAPNITSDPVSGIGAWSEDELVQYLRSGHLIGKAQAAGGMAEAVSDSLRHLDDTDLHAMAAYLKTVAPLRDPQQTLQRSAAAGLGHPPTGLEPLLGRQPGALSERQVLEASRLYNAACASCHQLDGAGTSDQYYPALNHNSATGDIHANNLIMAILRGVQRRTNDQHIVMPAFADDLDDQQVAAISNYVLAHFGNPLVQVTTEQVAQARANGPASLLLRAAPYVLAALLLMLVLLGVGGWRLIRRRRSARPA